MGTALGLALKAAGYRVEIVVAQGPDHARRAAKAIGGGVSIQLSWTVSLTLRWF